MKIKILLIINKDKDYSKQVIDLFKNNFNKVKIIDHNNFNNNLKNDYDYVISYLSKKILNKKFLNKTKIFNINFHPGPPKYPGIGCFNFALYSNEKSYGVTAHIINETIDSGKIIKERNFKINDKYDVLKISKKSYKQMFLLAKDIVKMIKNKDLSFSGQKWQRKAYTRNDLNKLAEIKTYFTKKHILRIVRCLYMPNKPKPYIKLNGIKFEYINE
jgi:methionyl-tRNA formyltransferase